MNKYKPEKLILTAGPIVGKKEIAYVTDAVKYGWNEHHSDYLHKFEKKFAQYIGIKYALATSGGTGALHLALAALDIGPGDEVILPEITYFACSDVIRLLGAKPVFVDILEDTWCINPLAIKKAVTKKTRAIMPVHIYGNLADMDEIKIVAKNYGLYIVEDACPAVGSVYKGKKPGSFGEFGAFSFQGAKIITSAGFGGMLVTNNRKLYEKVKWLNNHGEDSGKKFWQTSIGYTYEMTNMQAAFALGQLENIRKFVAKKRQIFSWYFNRLGDIDGISMNYERPGTISNRWMTSIILDKHFGISRDEVILKLNKNLIDSRPFFYPISMFPIYREARTPVAHRISLNAINLPSSLKLKEIEVDYICAILRQILKI